jgi:hypothetical protein
VRAPAPLLAVDQVAAIQGRAHVPAHPALVDLQHLDKLALRNFAVVIGDELR